MKHDFIENEIIILSKQTLDLFLKDDNPRDLISLYCFYYYTAKWQKTNQPKATISYCANGLKCGEDKIRKNKQKLKKIGLIEDMVDRDKKTGKVKGWYVKIKYIWDRNHPISLPEGGIVQRVDNTYPNALSANSINALSANSKRAENFEDKISTSLEEPKYEPIQEQSKGKNARHFTNLARERAGKAPLAQKSTAKQKKFLKSSELYVHFCQEAKKRGITLLEKESGGNAVMAKRAIKFLKLDKSKRLIDQYFNELEGRPVSFKACLSEHNITNFKNKRPLSYNTKNEPTKPNYF